MTKIFSLITHGNVNPEFYKDNISYLRERNTNMLKIAFGAGTAVNIGLLIVTFIVPILFEMRNFYIFFTAWFIIWTILAFTCLSRHTGFAKFFYAVFAGSVLTMTAFTSSYYSPDMCAVIYMVFLILIPGLYVSRPTGCISITVLSGVIFCFMTAYFKTDTYIISVDIINTIFSMVIGIAFNLYSINIQLQNLQASINLNKQSITDELTLLPNRRCFNINIGNYFADCADSEMVIYMMDIDYFKKYNDTFGHIKGDECLSLVGKSLMKTAREYDIFVARYGGEEFVAVSRNHNEFEAYGIANALVESVRELQISHPDTSSRIVTLSVGYAASQRCQAENYMQLINFADEALYSAKREGRNTYKEYGAEATYDKCYKREKSSEN